MVSDPPLRHGRLIPDDGSRSPPGLRALRLRSGQVYVVDPWMAAMFRYDETSCLATFDEEACPDIVMKEWDGQYLRFVEEVD